MAMVFVVALALAGAEILPVVGRMLVARTWAVGTGGLALGHTAPHTGACGTPHTGTQDCSAATTDGMAHCSTGRPTHGTANHSAALA